MASFTKFQKYAIFGFGACSGIAAYYMYNHRASRKVFTSYTTNYQPSVKWDSNWDFRDPAYLVKPVKNSLDIDEENKHNENLEKSVPKATRHLLLIRHGQYNLDGKTDEERTLTQLGQSQANYTGMRLKELNLDYTKMVCSTMTRAQETGNIILKSLNDLTVEHNSLLEEGAPIPPEPPVGHWKPQRHQFFQDGARIEAAFRKYFHREAPEFENDTYTVIVCHANVIRYFVCRALQFPPEAWLRLSLNHASITWISITPKGRVILRTLGDSGHIPAPSVTSR